jgi:hypothetical protein
MNIGTALEALAALAWLAALGLVGLWFLTWHAANGFPVG